MKNVWISKMQSINIITDLLKQKNIWYGYRKYLPKVFYFSRFVRYVDPYLKLGQLNKKPKYSSIYFYIKIVVFPRQIL